MKDNKIDIMCKKIADLILWIGEDNLTASEKPFELDVKLFVSHLRQLQYDLEILRKCTLDNPDFDWKDVK